ncbi:predicted protein [Uncinocarpus reesii 1704]|uniref:Uncharacterized protein n=1 Tax=Uncinocarpus reesii (strain UAMH 1704) TaxID=336963 RepID=C4JFI7_UNCRE|nr:uncharacterized protein UREG_01001 [Uncinocarpus reesii 1704]EEP76152.1 predicted protein [Uncinocarpus reesii 1704]
MSNLAKEAERDLNSYQAKQGVGPKSTSIKADESGVNADVERRFPGSEVKYGSAATTGTGDNRPIPEEEGGRYDDRGRLSKAKHFEGPGGPEDKMHIESKESPGARDTLT